MRGQRGVYTCRSLPLVGYGYARMFRLRDVTPARFKSRPILAFGDAFPQGYLGKQQVLSCNLNNTKTDRIDSRADTETRKRA